MVHQFCSEDRLGGVFLDFLGVFRVIANGAGRGLAETIGTKHGQTKDDA
jgi:hypothetical protein